MSGHSCKALQRLFELPFAQRAAFDALQATRRRLLGAQVEPLLRCGRYVLERRLGEGGGGVVFAAHDPELGRDIAVKLLRGDVAGQGSIARLKREAETLARIDHPNVVRIFDVGEYDLRDTVDDDLLRTGDICPHGLYLVMELVEGPSFAQWLDASARDTAAILAILEQVAHGLLALHQRGLIHRDLKPSNIVVGLDGRARIIDFGLAKLGGTTERLETVSSELECPPVDRVTTVTETGYVMGTASYMAPEQHGLRPLDARTDVYALAVTAWVAFTGSVPFPANSPHALLAAKHLGALPRIRGPRRCMRPVLARALHPEPERRHASPTAFVQDLRATRSRARSSRLALTVFVAFCLAAVALGVASVRSTPTAATPVRNTATRGLQHARMYGWLARGRATVDEGCFLDAREHLERAYYEAEALAVPRARLVAATGLAEVAIELGPTAAADVWLAAATSVLEQADATRLERIRLVQIRAAAERVTQGYELSSATELRALGTLRKAVGVDDPRWAAAASSYAMTLVNLGLSHASLHVIDVALAVLEREVGPRHRWTIGALANKGTILLNLDRHERAVACLREAVRRGEEVLGLGHPTVVEHLAILTNALAHGGQLDEANASALRTAHALRWGRGQSMKTRARALEGLAQLHHLQGDLEQARRLYARAIDALDALATQESLPRARTMSNLALVLHALGEDVEASRIQSIAVATLEDAVGPEHAMLGQVLLISGAIALRSDPAQADEAYARAETILAATLGRSHPSYATALHGRALAAVGLGRRERAIRWLERALSLHRAAGASQSELEVVRRDLARVRRRLPLDTDS